MEDGPKEEGVGGVGEWSRAGGRRGGLTPAVGP